MTQHMPGPWIVRGDDGTPLGCDPAFADVPVQDGARVADGAAVDWPFFIRQDREFATGEVPLHIATGIQRDADARLIASAPAMLAELRRVGTIIDTMRVIQRGKGNLEGARILDDESTALWAVVAMATRRV